MTTAQVTIFTQALDKHYDLMLSSRPFNPKSVADQLQTIRTLIMHDVESTRPPSYASDHAKKCTLDRDWDAKLVKLEEKVNRHDNLVALEERVNYLIKLLPNCKPYIPPASTDELLARFVK